MVNKDFRCYFSMALNGPVHADVPSRNYSLTYFRLQKQEWWPYQRVLDRVFEFW